MKILSILTILALILFTAFPSLDLATSHLFYSEGQGFVYRKAIISQMIYYSVRFFTLSISMVCLFVIFYDTLRRFFPAILQKFFDKIRALIKFSRKQMIYLLLVIVITPGILVHWVMKPVWDRARPVNITEFGGEKQYTQFFHLRAGQDGNSFPSGHASMAFALVAFAYIVSERNRSRVFNITMAYGVIASLCRVVQGGHYLSDVTFSALLTLFTVVLVKRFF